jgi:hypothetical protein
MNSLISILERIEKRRARDESAGALIKGFRARVNKRRTRRQGDRANASPFAAEARELAWGRLPAVRQGFSELSSKRIQIQRLEIQAIPSFNLPVLNDSNGL